MNPLPVTVPRFAKHHVLPPSRGLRSHRMAQADNVPAPASGAQLMSGQARFAVNETEPGVFRCSLRSRFNVPLLFSSAMSSVAQCEQAMPAFARASGDDNAYRIEPQDGGFVLVVCDPQGTELARSRPIAGQALARATLKLSVLQSLQATRSQARG